MRAEQQLVRSISGSPPELHEAVDHLVGWLLSECAEYSGRPTDGVILEWERVGNGRASGAGTIVMIDGQLVEPIRVEFVVAGSGEQLVSGFVHLGDVDTGEVVYGSPGHRQMVKRMRTDPTVEFRWRERFSRDREGWHREPPSKPPRIGS